MSVNRAVLDFDLERRCAQSCATDHVYVCLACGVYLRGKSTATEAYVHALLSGHDLFASLATAEVWRLPDNQKVDDPALNDIKQNVNPTYTALDIQRLDQPPSGPPNGPPASEDEPCVSVSGGEFIPGFIGINNQTGHTDYVNVVLQLLCRINPLRQVLLSEHVCRTDIAASLSQVIRRLCNRQSLKGLVSIDTFLRLVEQTSPFRVAAQASPAAFLSWLLSMLMRDKACRRALAALRGEFQGRPFFYLPVKLPEAPLFVKNATPEIVSIYDSLAKYDVQGTTLPKYLFINIQRDEQSAAQHFAPARPGASTTSAASVNHCIVSSPLRGVRLGSETYELIAVVANDSGTFKVLLSYDDDSWLEIKDQAVTRVVPQTVAVAEAYISLYRAATQGAESTASPHL